MFIAFNFLVPALLGIVFLYCKVVEIARVGSSTLLVELSSGMLFTLSLGLFSLLVYVRTYCVNIATLNQNKRSRLLPIQ